MSRPRGFSPIRDLPALLWLIATGATTLVHPFIPAPRWLMMHLLLLGAVTHSIMVWSRHFADTLLHVAPATTATRTRRLLLLNGGVLVVIAGVLLATWPVAAVGAGAVVIAVVWHGVDLFRDLRRALAGRFAVTVRYYVAAAALLPIGAGLGALMVRGLDAQLQIRAMLAHAALNVLGWMGLTVVGTLLTLWPTMLRTRIPEGAERRTAAALPVLLSAVLVTAGGTLAGSRPIAVIGLLAYLAGLVLLARPFAAAARVKPPRHYATWSVLAAVSWLVGGVVALTIAVGTADTWSQVHERVGWITPALAAGFAAQILLGALSYLIPVALGGGPRPVRAATEELDRGGALRITLINAALLVSLLPVPSVVRVITSVLVLVGLAAFGPLLFRAIRASRRVKAATNALPHQPPSTRPAPAPPLADRPRGQLAGLAAAGLAVVALGIATGVAVDPALSGSRAGQDAAAGAAATGETTRVRVEMVDMRFVPDRIEVPAGDRLVIELINADDGDVHDLVLDSGVSSGRLRPGESTVLDVGVVGRPLDGWCSVIGHRQMGMVLRVEVIGAQSIESAGEAEAPRHTQHAHTPAGGDPATAPPPGFAARDATLPPLPETRVHRHTFTVSELERAVAPEVTQQLWVYNGTMPGPVLHGRVGDEFVITLVNDGSIGHSIDFHAGSLAPDRPMRTIPPGESLTYRFTAARAGIWMYHCSTMPMSAHIANGMFGAVVIEPPDLPEADHNYLLVQSELYLGEPGGQVDVDKLAAEQPDLVIFNGYANQYDHQPLPAQVGQRVRVWVLNAGPNRPSSFHVVGGQFDTVWSEGTYQLRPDEVGQGGAQVLPLLPAQGGFVELTFPEPGRYPFVSHVMVDAERGAHGIFHVTD